MNFENLLIKISLSFLVANEELRKKNYHIDKEEFAKNVRNFVRIYNYTLDQQRLIDAISFMYSPWNDPDNETLIRQGLIDVMKFL